MTEFAGNWDKIFQEMEKLRRKLMAMEQQEGAAFPRGVPGIELIDEFDGEFDQRVSIVFVRFAE